MAESANSTICAGSSRKFSTTQRLWFEVALSTSRAEGWSYVSLSTEKMSPSVPGYDRISVSRRANAGNCEEDQTCSRCTQHR
eukprot:2129210-Rhodomonas_salina.4